MHIWLLLTSQAGCQNILLGMLNMSLKKIFLLIKKQTKSIWQQTWSYHSCLKVVQKKKKRKSKTKFFSDSKMPTSNLQQASQPTVQTGFSLVSEPANTKYWFTCEDHLTCEFRCTVLIITCECLFVYQTKNRQSYM